MFECKFLWFFKENLIYTMKACICVTIVSGFSDVFQQVSDGFQLYFWRYFIFISVDLDFEVKASGCICGWQQWSVDNFG